MDFGIRIDAAAEWLKSFDIHKLNTNEKQMKSYKHMIHPAKNIHRPIFSPVFRFINENKK
jgi:hypothetical protein